MTTTEVTGLMYVVKCISQAMFFNNLVSFSQKARLNIQVGCEVNELTKIKQA